MFSDSLHMNVDFSSVQICRVNFYPDIQSELEGSSTWMKNKNKNTQIIHRPLTWISTQINFSID